MSFRAVSASLALLLVLSIVPASLGDDVPSSVRTHYDEAKQHFEAGDLKQAYKAISKGKLKSPASVDFWQLYVAIYRGYGKRERVLWEKIIAKAETKHAGSPVFHILRYRLAEDAGARIAHLEAAMRVAPDAVEPRALLGREYVRSGDGASAEPFIEDVLQRDPQHELALALRGDLRLLEGRNRSAMEYAEAKLQRHDYPALHDLLARALLAVGGREASLLGRAEQEVLKARQARPDEWRYALTLAEVLDRQGKSPEAKALLVKTQAKTPAPEMAAKLGEFAFREGDYVTAARGIALHPNPDVLARKALITCHVRLGDAEAARAAIDALPADADADATRWIAARELEVGDAKAARRRLEGLDDMASIALRLRAAAWEGDAAEAKRIAGKRARGDARRAEAWFLPIAEALLLERLAERADAARSTLLAAASSAARATVAAATVPDEEPLIATHTLGYLQRHATYRRCLDGSFFEPDEELALHQRSMGDDITPTATVEARSSCARDSMRKFPFRPANEIREHDLQATMATWLGDPSHVRWSRATGGFAGGCSAILDGDYVAARAAFDTALEMEPAWGRARLFRAVAIALSGENRRDAARDAEQVSVALIDDWEGRTVAILVRLLAGQSVATEAKSLAERRESFAKRRYEDL